MVWPMFKMLEKKSTAQASQPTDTIAYRSKKVHPNCTILNEFDFRTCINKARMEFGLKELSVTKHIKSECTYQIAFCEGRCDCLDFESADDLSYIPKREIKTINAKWVGLPYYWSETTKVMKRTCEIARKLIEARAEKDRELGEDPVVVEEEELEEEDVWVEKEDCGEI